MATTSRDGWVYLAVMILSGTLNTVFSKMQYDVRSLGTELCVDPTDASRQTTYCLFNKPWFSSLLARIGMALPLVCLHVRHLVQSITRQRKRLPDETSRLLPASGFTAADAIHRSLPGRTIAIIAALAVLDQLQTLLANVGLLWVSSSVYQMARGSVILFSALISVRFLKTHLYAYHIVSLVVVAVSVVLVSWSGLSHDASDTTSVPPDNAILGLSLIVLAQLITAVQIVAEEHMMNVLHVDPLVLVGVEGLWGLVFYVFLIPILTLTPDAGSAISSVWHEDFYDSFVKISNSKAQVALSLLNIASVAALGTSCNYVTKHLSSVVRSIAEVLRTLGVWVFGLVVFYVFNWRGADSPGEAWTFHSWLELAGFLLMVYGTLAYKKAIPLPLIQ